MDDELSCFGCLRLFETRKRLHAHEAICKAKKRLQVDILQSQKRLSKSRRKLRKAGSLIRRGSLVKTVTHSHASRSPSLQPVSQTYSRDFFDNDVEMVCSLFCMLLSLTIVLSYKPQSEPGPSNNPPQLPSSPLPS